MEHIYHENVGKFDGDEEGKSSDGGARRRRPASGEIGGADLSHGDAQSRGADQPFDAEPIPASEMQYYAQQFFRSVFTYNNMTYWNVHRWYHNYLPHFDKYYRITIK